MCNQTGIDFGTRMLVRDLVTGHDVIEVGALDVNGSLRSHVESLGPKRYLGVDIELGPGVDEVADAAGLVAGYGAESFDLVITTEMLEHTRNWSEIISNLKRVLRPGGHLLVTTRSPGFPYHAYPYDFWRYEPDDLRVIFGDMEIITIERDSASPGVFMLARRPEAFLERTTPVALFSIITGRRSRTVSDLQVRLFTVRYGLGMRLAGRRPNLQLRRRLRKARPALIRARNATWRLLPGGARSFLKRVVFRRA
jgi:SAM-dependent methyltransferase